MSRIGLYIMVFIILLLTCHTCEKVDKMERQLDRIEMKQ